MYWLLGTFSQLSLQNKIGTAVYKQIVKPIRTHGIALWGITKKSNLNEIEKSTEPSAANDFAEAPWFVRNEDLHWDLRIPTAEDDINRYAAKHMRSLSTFAQREIPTAIRQYIRLQKTASRDQIFWTKSNLQPSGIKCNKRNGISTRIWSVNT